MSFSLFPKSPKFFDLFREQNRTIVQAATVLEKIVQEAGDCEERCQTVNMIEAEGDIITRNITHQLSTTFITPIDREDIHEINVSQEAILNHIQAVSARIGVYGFTRVRFPARRMVSNLRMMVTEVGAMLAKLGGKEEVEQNVRRVKELKGECEMLLLSGLAELYDVSAENCANILDTMKWNQVYDRIDKAVGRSWGLAKTIEGIVLKNA
ncbi:DUF47 family protein [Desulfovibrio aminophilus]|nr:DUF47 family protein [Desulfovibrio aminophilus]MCM0756586.1 DUF47 family protein [Desulfovibrio aminophilus]